ncbi:MAG: DUF3160 domain-containing protein [Candidatus Heimdallarchaeaceae archaeon]
MLFTNPKKPVLTGIIITLVVSSLIIGGFYLHLYNLKRNYYFREQFQLPQNVKNAFGNYSLPALNYTPSIVPTPIQADLANVNLQGLGGEINNSIKQKLETYGFALVDKGIKDIFSPMYYDDNLYTPMYISADFCLHALHSIFDNCLRIIELEYFIGNFSIMLNALRNDQMDLYSISFNATMKEALKYNIAYLSVLMSLLDKSTSIPFYVNSLVSEELENIQLGEIAISPIFNLQEDYSQYKPRGHYTRNSDFENYFKAMMYAGRMGFLLDDLSETNELGIKQTRMALALVYSFSVQVNNKSIWEYWNNICQTTSFLVGGSDDLTPLDYFAAFEENGKLNFADLSKDSFIREKIKELKELRAPKINSQYVGAFEGNENAIQGFRLFGQSYTPDAYIFQELVYDNLPNRFFPQALDIFSVLGSERAECHLSSEKVYTGYEEKIQELRNEFGNLSISDWTQNVYWQWLFSLLPLLEEKGNGYPGYMLSNSWLDKSLMTALASWVELKHDTILYAKQAYSAKAVGGDRFHYVEPYPKLYNRIAATLRMLKEGLKTRNLLYKDPKADEHNQIYSDFNYKFEMLISIFDKLTEISIKELENQELTLEELSFIHYLGKKMQELISYPENLEETYTTEADKRTALIADVFTEPNSKQVLEVAVGNPFLIYVVVQDHEGKLYLTRGVTFSYYEFKQPYNNRLTDEEWQVMVDSNPPELPSWITNNIPIIIIEEVVRTSMIALDYNSSKEKPFLFFILNSSSFYEVLGQNDKIVS